MELFAFESDFAQTLRCIPMQVRWKLDTCGIKLQLAEWSKCSGPERFELATRACRTGEEVEAYRAFLCELVRLRCGVEAKELVPPAEAVWKSEAAIPALLAERARMAGCLLSLESWGRLSELQRFALVKLSKPSHESRNFAPALREFGLLFR